MVIRCNGIEIIEDEHVIRHGDRVCYFRGDPSFKLMKHLILGFHNKEELFDLLYGHRDDGGPEAGPRQISIMLTQHKRIFRELNLELRSQRGAHYWTRYQLVPIGDNKWMTSPKMNSRYC